jgi:hypothetical protein
MALRQASAERGGSLRLERLAGLVTLAATAIDPVGRSLPCLVKVERVPHDLSPNSRRLQDEVDARPGVPRR